MRFHINTKAVGTIGIGILATFAFMLGALQPCASETTIAGLDAVSTHVAASSKYLDAFDQSRALRDLRAAVDELGFAANVHAMTAESFLAERRALVGGWARAMRTIELSYDPAFNPSAPESQVQFGLPDPSTIADPREREAARAAIARNVQNSKNFDRFLDLKEIDDVAMASFDPSLRHIQEARPSKSSRDSEALDAILRQAGISEARRRVLDAAIKYHAQ